MSIIEGKIEICNFPIVKNEINVEKKRKDAKFTDNWRKIKINL